jgi:hypothetical protein
MNSQLVTVDRKSSHWLPVLHLGVMLAVLGSLPSDSATTEHDRTFLKTKT